MTCLWSTRITKVMLWREGAWAKYGHNISNADLRVCYDQILITTPSKVLESINVHQKIKGIHKEDILVLIFLNSDQRVRKIKFQIPIECLQKLNEVLPIVGYSSQVKLKKVEYRNINDYFKSAVEGKENLQPSTLTSSSDFNSFVKLCLLDPTFPQVVSEVQKFLEDVHKNN